MLFYISLVLKQLIFTYFPKNELFCIKLIHLKLKNYLQLQKTWAPFLRYLKQKKPLCGNQVLFYFPKYLKKYTLYKKSRALFFKFYQALFTIRKQGYTIRSTCEKVCIKVLLRKLVKKGKCFPNIS